MKNVISILQARGFIDQMTSDALVEHVKKPVKIYVGFDPTADSLHLGNLVGIMALAWFQREGHTAVPILGGATGRIGDPSGKSVERPLLEEGVLETNIARIKNFLEMILPSCKVVNNFDWLGSFSVVDFLRDVGKHFRLGPMLGKEMVRTRLQSEEGMSFTEFTYQILQAYDFYYLHQNYGVTVQMGGSDQWGNITAGIEFNRKLGGDAVFGATWPLLTRSDGKKFGKSEGGAIWLASDRLSPYQFYQYLYGVPDADVIKLLKMLTFLELEEIEGLEREMERSPNQAQKRLAEEVTRFVHGEEGVRAALRVTEGIKPGAESELTAEMLQELAKDMPNVTLLQEEVVGHKCVDLFVKAGLAKSKSEASRLIEGGGAYLNQKKIEAVARVIEEGDLIEGQYLVVSSGKKKKVLVTLKNI